MTRATSNSRLPRKRHGQVTSLTMISRFESEGMLPSKLVVRKSVARMVPSSTSHGMASVVVTEVEAIAPVTLIPKTAAYLRIVDSKIDGAALIPLSGLLCVPEPHHSPAPMPAHLRDTRPRHQGLVMSESVCRHRSMATWTSSASLYFLHRIPRAATSEERSHTCTRAHMTTTMTFTGF